jgi:uncharacterized membrane protein YfcA
MTLATLLVIGFLAGILSGLFGIGGGLVIVPCLVAFLGFETKQAVGTSLAAILLPVGILGVWTHYKAGNVNFKYSLLLDVGLFFGALIGAKIMVDMDKIVANRLFAAFLIIEAIKMALGK